MLQWNLSELDTLETEYRVRRLSYIMYKNNSLFRVKKHAVKTFKHK